jgi:hypothetical protein
MPYKNKEDKKKYMKRYYDLNKEKFIESKERMKKKVKKIIDDNKVCCKSCGSKDSLTFHHRKEDEKKFTITQSLRRLNVNELRNEIKKCDVLCKKCHMKLHRKYDYEKIFADRCAGLSYSQLREKYNISSNSEIRYIFRRMTQLGTRSDLDSEAK